MALVHMVWLTPKAGVTNQQMNDIVESILALKHLPGVISISAGSNLTDRANGASHGATIVLESLAHLPAYIDHPDHQKVGLVIRECCEVAALDYETE